MILEDYYSQHPDLQPWDPRIKEIAMQHSIMTMQFNFIVYLHCQRKVGWTISEEFAATISAASVRDLIQEAIQPLIEEEYKKLQKMAGGAVDIQGRPIKAVSTGLHFSPVWNKDKTVIEAFNISSDELSTIQLTDEEQFNIWTKQAASLNAKLVYNEPGWKSIGYTAEGIIHPAIDTGSIVQSNLKKLFPALSETVKCPVCSNTRKTDTYRKLDKMIIHLNDDHTWTREQVADWLESLDIDLEMQENV